MAGHVAEQDRHAVLVEREHVVEVAALRDLVGRAVVPGDEEAGEALGQLGHERILHDLVLQRGLVRATSVPQRVRAEEQQQDEQPADDRPAPVGQFRDDRVDGLRDVVDDAVGTARNV